MIKVLCRSLLILVCILLIGTYAHAGWYHVNTSSDVVIINPGGGETAYPALTLICYDCHSMHASETLGNSPTNPYNDGRSIWVSSSNGPRQHLLKADTDTNAVSAVCLRCHDGKTFAPDVKGANTNSSNYGRAGGALTDGSTDYANWKGHTIGAATLPPGNTTDANLDWYSSHNAKYEGLQCISCHNPHGKRGIYRNLGPSKGNFTPYPTLDAARTGAGGWEPTDTFTEDNDYSKDVWQKNYCVGCHSYPAAANGMYGGSGNSTMFKQNYSFDNVRYNRIDNTFLNITGGSKSSNKVSNFCALCHGGFHGGSGNANINDDTTNLSWLRHPTGQQAIGAVAAAAPGSGRYSNLDNYKSGSGASYKWKVHTNALWVTWSYFEYSGTPGSSEYAASGPTPFCLTCHKAHGSKNAFGLFFLKKDNSTIDEGGSGYSTPQEGYRNLCQQCHNVTSG
ncbi:MAG: hypothetical protein A2073_01220 [Deltaproteobacteria bacterium GWC2_42_11]|nr:MAG: hypothetical protein A2073_01220 [Deltaproteobacteria bacterium GWC2_42_11]